MHHRRLWNGESRRWWLGRLFLTVALVLCGTAIPIQASQATGPVVNRSFIPFLSSSAAVAGNSTVTLNDANQVSAQSAGNGLIRTDGTAYQQFSAINGMDTLGYASGERYRAYVQWDTGTLPKNVPIQSVGLRLRVVNGYGAGNTVSVRKLSQPIFSYLQSQAGLSQLFAVLGSNPCYWTGLASLRAPGEAVIPLGGSAAGDLQYDIANNLPFGVALSGSNETDALASWYAKQDTTAPDEHPALVVSYGGVRGGNDGMIRPLRTSFWDGTYYWQFTQAADGQYYYYSPDAVHWTMSGRISTDANRHFGIWYQAPNTVWVASSTHVSGLPVNANNLEVQKGTISGATITWSSPVVVFRTITHPGDIPVDGYDFPSIVLDSKNRCWVVARHYYGTENSPTASATAGVEVKQSTGTDCTSWGPPTALVDLATASGPVHLHGGYVVPLPKGQIYAVYKDQVNGAPVMYGRLFDGAAWQPPDYTNTDVAPGVYLQGMSVVAARSTVHLVYVAADGSIRYNSRGATWGTATTLNGAGSFFSPGLSLDTSTGNLEAFYRSAASCSQPNAAVYAQVGVSRSSSINWAPATVIANTWTPTVLMQGDARWALSSPYASPGHLTVTFVDGLYDLKVLPAP